MKNWQRRLKRGRYVREHSSFLRLGVDLYYAYAGFLPDEGRVLQVTVRGLMHSVNKWPSSALEPWDWVVASVGHGVFEVPGVLYSVRSHWGGWLRWLWKMPLDSELRLQKESASQTQLDVVNLPCCYLELTGRS